MELKEIAKIITKVNTYKKDDLLEGVAKFLEQHDDKSKLEIFNMYYPDHLILNTKDGIISLGSPEFITGEPRVGYFLKESNPPCTDFQYSIDNIVDLSEYRNIVADSAIEYMCKVLLQLCINDLTKYCVIPYFKDSFTKEELNILKQSIELLER